MSEISTPKVTIDELARMIAKGFRESKADINRLENKIDILDEKLGHVSKDHGLRIRRLEQKVGII